jgi:serine/threonine-protein kinase
VNSLDSLRAAFADRYTIEREIGRGGMATVYLADDLRHHREVAIKVFRPELAAALGSERFLREVEITASLNHPHILPLLDSGRAVVPPLRDTEMGTGGEAFLYYVMPYVEGETLRERLKREGQLPLDDAVQIAREVAAALSYAHSHDVIHRDIKPENVLLSAGEAVVADFGIARAISKAGGEELTETGISVGTPVYMSPEQASGAKEVDARSDVYSLGCVLYEMLSGEPPFTGPTTQAVMARHAVDPVPPLRTVRETVPGAVDAAIVRALAKVPADRYGTVQQFSDALASAPMALTPAAADVPPAERSIAVLPFANMSADPENEYFSDGLSEDLINALAKIPDFRVAARTSAFSFKGEQVDARAIGRKLSVETVLEGSVRKAGNRLRITAQLINAADGYHVWSEQYDRVMADVFDVQDEITLAIVDALKIELLVGEESAVRKKHTANVEAYHLYLKGRYYWNRSTTEAFRKAIDHFQRAIDVDPTYALAYAGMADAYAGLGDAGHSAVSPKEAFSSARAAVQKALELDDTLAEAHASLGHLEIHEFAWSEAQRAFKRAIELNPNYATAYHTYAFSFAASGRLEEAIATLERAVELDPVSLGIATNLGVLFYFARRYDQAVEQYHKVLDMDPSFARVYVTLGSAYAQMGRHEESVAMFQKAIELSGDRSKIAALGRAYALAGKKEEALEIIEELQQLSRKRYVTPYAVALIYASMGEKDEAFSWLQRACEEGVSDLIYMKVDPFLDNLRSDPRFSALMDSVGFE